MLFLGIPEDSPFVRALSRHFPSPSLSPCPGIRAIPCSIFIFPAVLGGGPGPRLPGQRCLGQPRPLICVRSSSLSRCDSWGLKQF